LSGPGPSQGDRRVAIVAVGAVYPGAPDPDAFWQLIVAGDGAIRPVPAGRWPIAPDRALGATPGGIDRVACLQGGFVDDEDLGDTAGAPAGLDRTFRYALHAGAEAWGGAKTGEINPARVGVILGQIILPTESASRHAWDVLGRTLREQATGDDGSDEGEGPIDPENLRPGEMTARHLARALGLRGPAWTLDAACASSLYSLALASEELRTGRLDAVLAGGVSAPDPFYTQMGFTQLRALSPSGWPRPFDAAADGLIVGEGAGIFLLKRVEDALAHGDKILAVLAGYGLSNDVHGNVLAPSSEGQLRAMRAAYGRAGLRPSDVDFIECHATGTPVGDGVELESLKALWADAPASASCPIGSVKGNVGHALTGAGAAGVLKLLLAMENGLIPPATQVGSPHPKLAESPFRLPAEPQPWHERDDDAPPRAAISGFGFGGINAHVLLEAEPTASGSEAPVVDDGPIAIVGLSARIGDDSSGRVFREWALAGRLPGSSAPARDWGVGQSRWFRGEHPGGLVPGLYLDGLEVPHGRFRIPPREQEAMLLQQVLMLLAASDAAEDAGWGASEEPRLKTGVIVGLELDPNTTNYHVRWMAGDRAAGWAGGEVAPDWAEALKDSAGPPLTADRTMGGLGGLVASRVARELRLGGPSFTVSSGRSSGLTALSVAVGMLRRGELDEAVVGAVDLIGDPRSLLLRDSGDAGIPADAAGAVVLKRYADALRDGDRVIALIDDIAWQPDSPDTPIEIDAGAATAWLDLLRQAMRLSHRIRPAGKDAAYWLRDSEDGPRGAEISHQGWSIRLLEAEKGGAVEDEHPLWSSEEGLFVVEADDSEGLVAGLRLLRGLGESGGDGAELAARWRQSQGSNLGAAAAVALLARDGRELSGLAEGAIGSVREGRAADTERIRYEPHPLGPQGRLAFVFPGSGNQFAGMGQALSAAFPSVYRCQEARNRKLRSQYAPEVFWGGGGGPADPRAVIQGQIAVGSAVSDLLRSFGIEPGAAIGYSLGETASLVALGAWQSRDELLERLHESELFTGELAGDCHAARRAWDLPASESADWTVFAVNAPEADVRAALAGERFVELLIINTDEQCVIGGRRPDVLRVVEMLKTQAWEVQGASIAHSAIVRDVADQYRDLHLLPTTPPEGVVFYSGAIGEPYVPDEARAAEAIVGHATGTIDFPRLIRRAYADGVRLFVEIGPGQSCTRMIGEILDGLPHLAVAACAPGPDPIGTLLRVLMALAAHRVPLDLSPLDRGVGEPKPQAAAIRLPVGRGPFAPPALPVPAPRPEPVPVAAPPAPRPIPAPTTAARPEPQPALASSGLLAAFAAADAANAQAHSAYLTTAEGFAGALAGLLRLRLDLLESGILEGELEEEAAAYPEASAGPQPFLDRDLCMEFAIGRIGPVLGEAFAEIDAFPTRVRLPDEPLMLVDRIVSVEGEPLSMSSGRLVTEHDVLPGAWYLDAGQAPACISIESGQADLFLSAYLGVDFKTRGLAMYRLLDATVVFHRGLPCPGETIRYDIRIERFFRQGEMHLFRFGFDGYADGEPLLSMRDGCAGFFTPADLAAGQGVVKTEWERQPRPGVRPPDWVDLAPMREESLSEAQVDALRDGDLVAAFGESFAGLGLSDPARLPGGRMRLVHRVERIEPRGGKYGLGVIRGEAEIHPDDWFLTCHFIDDQVMPGTLMYECCLHTFRIFLFRMGWIGEASDLTFEPVPGVGSRLKCRGQVTAATKKVTYEVVIKELGYRPEPYAIADALMYADGKPIVDVGDMTLQFRGTDRESIERLWAGRVADAGAAREALVMDRERILAFALGKPSDAFGAAYRAFDEGRFVARLPNPPYLFVDRVTGFTGGTPFRLAAGATAIAECDVDPDAWYFAEDRQGEMPYAVLVEVALQACGFLAAYLGSALTSSTDLYFRNLGGTVTRRGGVGRGVGLLRTEATITRSAASAGMIIEHFAFKVSDREGRPILDGTSYFGFFTPQSLADQRGLTEIPDWELPPEAAIAEYPSEAPFPAPRWRLVDRIARFDPAGGPAGLGLLEGEADVDPGAWYYAAHFYRDPVMAGSLGLEAMMQLLKWEADRRWGPASPDAAFEVAVAGETHSWSFRGQVLPTNRRVTVRAAISGVDEARKMLKADGILLCDGLPIYQMTDYTLRLAD
jgi:acyl transferase domain-containing protein/3-hydroxymyristoyl/3-hydroxydecanoyl-(acyl carrier protein) dehydratase